MRRHGMRKNDLSSSLPSGLAILAGKWVGIRDLAVEKGSPEAGPMGTAEGPASFATFVAAAIRPSVLGKQARHHVVSLKLYILQYLDAKTLELGNWPIARESLQVGRQGPRARPNERKKQEVCYDPATRMCFSAVARKSATSRQTTAMLAGPVATERSRQRRDNPDTIYRVAYAYPPRVLSKPIRIRSRSSGDHQFNAHQRSAPAAIRTART